MATGATLLLLAAVGSATAQTAPAPAVTPAARVRQLSVANKPWKGDLDGILTRRMLRVAVPYSRTLYFNNKGRESGLTAELIRDFERFVNKKYKTGKRPLTVYLGPTTRDKLLRVVEEGYADIAAGNLTVTQERLKQVDFVTQTDRPVVKELVVLGPRAAPVDSVEELSGRTVHVRKGSSYYESLTDLNARLKAKGLPESVVKTVPDALEDEDMMEMAEIGLIDILIVDDWKAKMWARVLPSLRVMQTVVLRDAGHTGWAVRKGSPKLEAAIQDFDVHVAKRTGAYAYRLQQETRRINEIRDPTRSSDWTRFESMIALFR